MTLTFLIEVMGAMSLLGTVAAASYQAGYKKAERDELAMALKATRWSYLQGQRDARKIGQMARRRVS